MRNHGWEQVAAMVGSACCDMPYRGAVRSLFFFGQLMGEVYQAHVMKIGVVRGNTSIYTFLTVEHGDEDQMHCLNV